MAIILGDARKINLKDFNPPYDVIVADPPWPYSNHDPQMVRADNHYKIMTIDEICSMPVDTLASKDGVLYLWGTWPLLPECLQVLKAWKFDYISGFPWIKFQNNFTLSQGMTGYWVYGVSEYVMIGKRGNAKPPNVNERYLGLIAPNLKHSRKPESVHQMAEGIPGKHLELFAREERPGWDCFGNEVKPYTGNNIGMFSNLKQKGGDNNDKANQEQSKVE